LERRSQAVLSPNQKRCDVVYTCVLKQKGRTIQKFQERHRLRYFDLQEMEGYLIRAGFKVLGAHPFLRLNGKIRRNTWDVTLIAQKA
ncbi:MAG: hypothetical protein Q7S13_04870, partial [Candidatus Omnitrophota bacterium]|nr:hypothetical protein [Candidatus Omnitrophota bacterium]